MNCRKSVPAFTLNVKCGTNIEFDVDFVFTFRFHQSKMWPAKTKPPQGTRFNYWNAIPKTPSRIWPRRTKTFQRNRVRHYRRPVVYNRSLVDYNRSPEVDNKSAEVCNRSPEVYNRKPRVYYKRPIYKKASKYDVAQRNFRVSLIEYENEMIRNKGTFKNLIRIFKV